MPVPDFILRLRERVGHDLLWLPGVTAVVLRPGPGSQGVSSGQAISGGQEVLCVRRADDGRWTAVTGIVDPGEHPAVTAVREVAEETGVRAEVEALVRVGVTGVVTYPNADRAQYLDHTFRCRYLSGEAHVADDESTEVAWFPVDALPPMSAHHTERVRAAVAFDGTVQLT